MRNIDNDNPMSIKRCRELIGPTAVNYSDDEIRQIRDQIYQLARVLVTRWFKERDLQLREKPDEI